MPMVIMIMLISSLNMLLNNNMIIINFNVSNYMYINMNMNIMMNWYSMSFCTTVILISYSIVKFSMNYIPKHQMKVFLMILSLFVLSMILMIISNNILFLILGWDGLGLTSYILVIFYQNNTSSTAGSITILTNRIGDILIIMSISMLLQSGLWSMSLSSKFSNMIMLMITIAAMTKSAQYPFIAWLPAAMAAPTPVSALVHSSTLVTAGVILIMRLSNVIHPNTMNFILIMAVLTSMMASLSAMSEMDLKKIIALSTLSQIAFMMIPISINLVILAHFHLIIHALFKATMFMCVGQMIHNTNYQDSRSIKNNSKNSPLMNVTLSITSMSLSGLPFMSGFYSKEAILESPTENNSLIWMLPPIIMLTSIYNLRIMMNCLSSNMMTSPDLMSSKLNNMTKSPSLMSPMSIISGSLLAWTLPPMNSPSMSLLSKSTPLIVLTMALIIASMLTPIQTSYKNCMLIMSSMWTMNFLSTNMSIKYLKLGNTTLKMDNSWKEYMTNISTNTMMSKSLNMYNKPSLLMAMFMIMTPLFFMIF